MAYYGPYISVSERKAKAEKVVKKLKAEGLDAKPVRISGNQIAKTFWGKGWCTHLLSFSDFANRLPRGKSYVRHGSVCHLQVDGQNVEALVSGSALYRVTISITPLEESRWEELKSRCMGKVGSLLELLEGKLSDDVMAVIAHRKTGLFPGPKEIKFSCDCPDSARMCKHIAAALYGIGHRLDAEPRLLFTLRNVEPNDLMTLNLSQEFPQSNDPHAIPDHQLEEIFGIDLDLD